jgi:parallel beta-helix repeat protein
VENVINFYNGDGLRGLGDNNVFLRNRVFNCIKTDGNHADGFQSFAGESGSVKGLVLDSNTIIEWTHPDGDHPLRCRLQGIGLFDGFYDDLTIINNLVTTTQYHGISVYGVRKGIISNNTVANTDGVTGPHPYIGVRNHKDGSLTTGVLVSNNLAMSFTGSSDLGSAVEYRNNSVIGTPGAVFENPFALDYRPKATSGFIDSGDAASAPAKDLLGNARPVGKGPDRGAIEVGGTTQPAPPEENEEIVAEGPTTEEPAVTTPEVKDPVVTEPVVTKPVVTKPAVNKRPRRSVSRWISESLNGVYKRARVRLSSR